MHTCNRFPETEGEKLPLQRRISALHSPVTSHITRCTSVSPEELEALKTQPLHSPVWLSCEVLLLLRDTMATTLALRLDLRFFPPAPTVPTAVSDWLPSLRSRAYSSPLTLVLFVMALPEVPIRLPCILGVNELYLQSKNIYASINHSSA